MSSALSSLPLTCCRRRRLCRLSAWRVASFVSRLQATMGNARSVWPRVRFATELETRSLVLARLSFISSPPAS